MAFEIQIIKTFVVDPTGSEEGSYKTIQDAILASPRYSPKGKWSCIHIKKGTYRERVDIPRDRPWTYLEGEGMGDTRVVSDGNEPLNGTATLITASENVLVKGISFINSYNAPGSSTKMKQAAAAMIQGEKSAFFDCGFFGLQDTLWDSSGRHYFHNCTIEGAVDFIFGGGRSIYEKCKISVVADRLNGTAGCITAHASEDPAEENGFVFKYCVVTGNGKTFLGRPWRAYARVVFYKTEMSPIVHPQGWEFMEEEIGKDTATFQEIECKGIGAALGGRVDWANKPLSKTELEKFLSVKKHINEEGWIPRQLIN